jgi:hypothetical protein
MAAFRFETLWPGDTWFTIMSQRPGTATDRIAKTRARAWSHHRKIRTVPLCIRVHTRRGRDAPRF